MTPSTIHDAIAHHQQGRLAEAESAYLQLLQKQPRDFDALHYLGVLRMRLGRREEAIELVKRSLSISPHNPDAWNNLGNMLLGGNEIETRGAELAYSAATQQKPDFAEAWYNLANLFRRALRRDDAVRCYRKVLDLNPRFAGAYENIAMLLLRVGRPDLTADVYRRWLAVEPDNPIARHMAAAYSNAKAPARADDAYVAQVFDRFAGNFDQALANLNYVAPSLLTAALAEVISFAERRLVVLDAGCGTGLCGPLLRSTARQLVGVDLSAGMLAKARERQVYDELHESELVAFMHAHPAGYDVVISADTLVYFGALEEAMNAAAGALKPGGVLAFTLEAETVGSPEKFRLHKSGRYSHSADYARECLEAAGFKVLLIEGGVLRQEAGADVLGHVVLARKGTPPLSA
ncbi:MAG TPA: tetratricopeptide repeat protein [Steroidobacteraceae bacterium]|nr:tetratricopeptide repeat protein [Steroidobacteraceae bacterium]